LEVFVRLNKYIALCGVSSRRKADELISLGKVTVNGSVVKTMGPDINAEADIVCVNGKKIFPEEKHVYIMLNKPSGYISACSDYRGRKTVLDLVKGVDNRIFPVGRLDYDTEGLILLTSDGDFAYRCTHPKHEINKKYYAVVEGALDEKAIRKLQAGVIIEGRKTSGAGIELIEKKRNRARLNVTIHEGRKRQIKTMFESVGCSVSYLKRVSIGNLYLGELALGMWRYLEDNDFRALGIYAESEALKQRK
jgi:23S rRNA pseudouridine2605 synthase